MDCPWCGCGWLFTCITCRKAFTFAEAVELDTTWEQLAKEDLLGRWHEEPSKEDIASWITAMQEILADIVIGQTYLIIDGSVFPVTTTDVMFDGWHAHLEFSVPPQVEALTDRNPLNSQLGNREYWTVNAHPQEAE